MSKKITAIYLRVSTKAQDNASQEPDLRAWADAQQGEIKWFTDTFTGTSMDRPAWKEIHQLIRRGKVARVVVWRLDRLGRTVSGLTQLFDELQERKVGLVSLKDGLDLTTPAGRLMANVLASVAQFETEIRAERIRAGQRVARENGVQWGGSPKGKRKKVTPTIEKACVRLRQENTSYKNIELCLGISVPTIRSICDANGLPRRRIRNS